MGVSSLPRVHTDWQNTSSGQILPHVFANAFEVFTTSAAPITLPDRIIEMNFGTSM